MPFCDEDVLSVVEDESHLSCVSPPCAFDWLLGGSCIWLAIGWRNVRMGVRVRHGQEPSIPRDVQVVPCGETVCCCCYCCCLAEVAWPGTLGVALLPTRS